VRKIRTVHDVIVVNVTFDIFNLRAFSKVCSNGNTFTDLIAHYITAKVTFIQVTKYTTIYVTNNMRLENDTAKNSIINKYK
jgi:hypothetical protein